jgi:hypothetical protein
LFIPWPVIVAKLVDSPLEAAGRLARAYLDGYNCDDDTELQLLCGAQL